MDKALFRAYVKELVKEQIEESVEKAVKNILPKLLGEAVSEIKDVQAKKINEAVPTKPKFSRTQLVEMMGLERTGDTIMATTKNVGPVMPNIPEGYTEDNPAVQAINKDYSAIMKAMKLA